jgi:hypothetical protein
MSKRTSSTSLRTHAARAAALLLVALVLIACDDVINDPTFRSWCGDTLCAWTLVEGHIKKAPTWTEKDYGVAFVDTPTTLSQSVSDSPKCLKFSTIADLDPSAQMTIAIDFDRDGTIDLTQPMGSAQWTEVVTLVTAPQVYSGFTLYLKKEGPGNAVLAQLRVQSATDCAGAPVALGALPMGDRCATGDPNGGAACETGICCGGLCAECCADTDCKARASADGGDAGAAPVCWVQPLPGQNFFPGVGNLSGALPGQCDPDDHAHLSGAPCLVDADCASGACVGALLHGIIPFGDGAACDPLADGGGCYAEYVAGGHCR